MRPNAAVRIAVFFAVCVACLCAAIPLWADETVKVEIRVTAPADTPANATLYLAGNLDAVGGWQADAKAFKRGDDGTYSLTLNLPRGDTLEYKITRGSWETVEKSDAGEEIDNRKIGLDYDKTEKITVARWADQSAPVKPGAPAPATPAVNTSAKSSSRNGVTGDVRYHERFHSDILHNDRRIIVWLPPTYGDDPTARFPVLYLQDGQNCFDPATSYAGEWHADEIADRLIRDGKIKPIIMVAVANMGSERMNEYAPTRDAVQNRGGQGEKYAQFLITEVKPFIDRTYRTMPDRASTAVGGSSLGGLISLYLGFKHGDVFGEVAAVSPSLQWNDRKLLKEIEADPSKLKDERIWIDIGTAEGSAEETGANVANARALAHALTHDGEMDANSVKYLEVPGGQHNEAAWSARFDQVLMFLFGS
jgi:predicted alpha/beta superfamily hydrolase